MIDKLYDYQAKAERDIRKARARRAANPEKARELDRAWRARKKAKAAEELRWSNP